ncbi:hypothetical protein Y88_0272 [Novosphingobium nitrogenifigens DSM 19370]|uniref:Uncharacterized protein n=1 Tax=Novosphingobium nitrogenifigens DSM 19370 TaxID=983920 RepID=F1ZB03_9SPHN|nr:hypothetical protein Y88_0272 [Novosphingobium nitrogenifigens DSM 19370]
MQALEKCGAATCVGRCGNQAQRDSDGTAAEKPFHWHRTPLIVLRNLCSHIEENATMRPCQELDFGT